MIRNLKILLGVALALMALGASVAQAHTPAQFHCAIGPCEATFEPDGTSGQATAHQVFVIRNGNGETLSLTCDTLTGESTSSIQTPTEVEFKNLVYSGCKFGADATGSTVVRMNGCKYNYTAAGTVTITGCNAGKKIEGEIVSSGCNITVGEQGPLTGIKYHLLGAAGQTPATTLVTGEAKVPGIVTTLDGSCPIPNVAPITSEVTTANTIVRGYKDGLTHNETNRLDVWWTATSEAHTPAQFHCATEPCKATLEPDGTSGQATAHHVFVVKNANGETVSFTCDTLAGEATSSLATPTEAEFKNITYSGCKAGADATGSTVVRMNGCKYNFTAAGTVTITGCEVGKKIEVEITASKCTATVAEQGPLTGVKFHNGGTAGQTPATTLVTGEARLPGIAVTLDGECPIPNKAPLTSEFTTGNTIVRGYKDDLTHNETNRLDVWWTATVA